MAPSILGNRTICLPVNSATQYREILPDTSLRRMLYQMVCVDLTQIDGLSMASVQTILSEIGTDINKWLTVKHFTSWRGLSPNNSKTGEKIIRTKTKQTDSRANLAFRQGASSLGRSQTALGKFFRRMKAKLGTPKAVVATAHKLARIVYHILKNKVPFKATAPEQEDKRYRKRALLNLKRQVQTLGAKLIVDEKTQVA